MKYIYLQLILDIDTYTHIYICMYMCVCRCLAERSENSFVYAVSSFPFLRYQFSNFFSCFLHFYRSARHGLCAVVCFYVSVSVLNNHITISVNAVTCPAWTVGLTNFTINLFMPPPLPPWAAAVLHSGDVVIIHRAPLSTLPMNNNRHRPWLVPGGGRCCKIIRLLLG